MKKRFCSILILLSILCGCAANTGGNVEQKAQLPPNATQSAAEPSQSTQAPSIPDASVPDAVSGLLEVYFIDVGQADAALLLCDGAAMLIDGGNVSDSSLMVSFLDKLGITHLDYVIGTHAHEDHIGGLAGALSACSAGTVYIPKTGSNTKAYQNFLVKAEQSADKIETPAPGTEVSLGAAKVVFLGPIVEDADNLNSTSVSCKVIFGNISFLFTGDAESDAERRMVDAGEDLSATVLKAPHHGSETSSSYVFLREVMPQYVVISVGADNSYGHPDENALSRFRDVGAEVYRTDLQGDIYCVSDGNSVQFSVEKNPNAVTNPTTVNGSGQNSVDSVYIGNVNSKKFHLPTCASLPEEKDRVFFGTRQDAVNAGYSPCGNCRP